MAPHWRAGILRPGVGYPHSLMCALARAPGSIYAGRRGTRPMHVGRACVGKPVCGRALRPQARRMAAVTMKSFALELDPAGWTRRL